MTTPLPLRPNLEQYHKQAKDLLRAAHDGDAAARARIESHRERADGPVLADAQRAIAREHGLPDWARFTRLIELIPSFREALYPGDAEAVRRLLADAPELADCEPWPGAPGYRPIQGVSFGCVWHRPQQTEVADLLVEAGARVDITIAARAGLVDRVRAMLDDDPRRIEARDDDGRSPLYRAGCVYGNFPPGEQIVDLLLERGASMDFFVACTFGLVDAVERFLAEDPGSSTEGWATRTDPDGMTGLHWAVRPRQRAGGDAATAVTQRLIDAGADVHARNPQEDQMQPLHHCGEWSACTSQVDLLLEAGADINAPAKQGWTPLDYALDRDRTGMVNSLRKRGAKESGLRQTA